MVSDSRRGPEPLGQPMRRRDLIEAIVGSAIAWPLAARAQQPGRMRLIGVLMSFAESDAAAQADVAAFRGELAKLGWTEGNNLRIELRWTASDPDKMKTFAKELVDLRPDVILSQSTPMTAALVRETQTIPIVVVVVSDPIGSGFATSLARPGGNVTGLAAFEPALSGKWVELLKEIAPRTERMVLLFNPATTPPIESSLPSIRAAASSLGIQVSVAPVHAKDGIEGVIAAQEHDGGLIAMPDNFNVLNRELIIALAARYGVPTIYYDRIFSESGGLISYDSDFTEQFRQAAGYIDRILKGAKPADLPIQTPTKFEMIINLKTAKALSLTVPPLMLGRADNVIE
jgi:putative tryptophan/tyrosine transport system substrate-binding protein